MSTGIFLARMQPLHNAHMWLLGKACAENDRVGVILGSANKEDMIRNPFSLELRERILRRSIELHIDNKASNKIEVYELPDWSQEGDLPNAKEWGKYLYYNVVSRMKTRKFSIYYSDDPNIMLNWFKNDLKKRINFRFFERDNVFDGLSATKIRESFENDDREYIKRHCPIPVVSHYNELREIWLKVINNPKQDFSMK